MKPNSKYYLCYLTVLKPEYILCYQAELHPNIICATWLESGPSARQGLVQNSSASN
jgi:hypothetical protein